MSTLGSFVRDELPLQDEASARGSAGRGAGSKRGGTQGRIEDCLFSTQMGVSKTEYRLSEPAFRREKSSAQEVVARPPRQEEEAPDIERRVVRLP